MWLANLAALELHTHQHRESTPDRPTAVVLDLDPGPPAGVLDCARVALDVRALLDRLGLTAAVKTSGSKGLHLSDPHRGADAADDERTKAFALALGNILAEAAPDRVTTVMAKERRPGKVFVDWSQNDRHKTTVAPYSLRAASAPDGVDPARLVGGRGRARRRRAGSRWSSRPTRCSRGSPQLGDLYAGGLAPPQELPVLG